MQTPNFDQPTVYDHSVARFLPLTYADDIDVQLARIFHARSTRVGIAFDDLPKEDRDALVSGTIHMANALAESLRSRLGPQCHAIVAEALREDFAGGDVAEILRKAEADLAHAIEDDRQFRARMKLEQFEARMREEPSSKYEIKVGLPDGHHVLIEVDVACVSLDQLGGIIQQAVAKASEEVTDPK